MIHIDESEPIGEVESSFPSRDVTIKRGVDAKEIYELLSEIGRGKFGTVYKCREKATGLELAAKFVPIPKRDDRRNVEREVEIMNSLQHSLVIQLYDAYEYQKMMCVVVELIEGGELFDRVIDDDFILTEKACIVFIRQVCQAMEFIHRSNILHLDLKPENILCLTREGNRIKIIDFGLARKYDPDKKLQVLFGTPEFVAPEVVNFDRICFGTDMWSVGVICYVLLSGLSPFMGGTDIETMANVTIGKYDFDDEAFANISKEALNFIQKLLVKDSSSRMTATECLEHIWLKRRAKLPPPLLQRQHSLTKPINQITTPIIPPLPESVIAPKEQTPPPIPELPAEVILQNSLMFQTDDNELKTTKDNLKSFIERWEEHPNSPYVFDTTSNRISPVTVGDDCYNNNSNGNKRNGSSSVLSSRACSPSPCGSISSDFPAILDEPTNTTEFNRQNEQNAAISAENGHRSMFKEYLQSFERRNSDSNCVLNRSSSCEKMDLAAEIKKLSDRLMMLSSINSELSDYNDKVVTENSATVSTKNKLTKSSAITSTDSKTVTVKKTTTKKTDTKAKSTDSPKTTKKSKINTVINGTTSSNTVSINSNESLSTKKSTFKRSSSVITNGSTLKTDSSLSERLKLLDETPILSQKFETSRNGGSSIKSSSTLKSSITQNSSKVTNTETANSLLETTSTNGIINSNGNATSAPWPITTKRTKFRITQMSRDVPMYSPNTHQTVFLDEEAVNTTKDCLLHLLEKYNQTDTNRSYTSLGMMGRHQTISDGFGISDNLEYRSMNSLNYFFQRHANAGTTVKSIQAQIESKNK